MNVRCKIKEENEKSFRKIVGVQEKKKLKSQ